MRQPDRPGSFRVTPKAGQWRMSGVTLSGDRVKASYGTEAEARRAGDALVGTPSMLGVKAPIVDTAPQATLPTDDWGLPIGLKVNPETIRAFAPAVAPGAGTATPTSPASPAPQITAEEAAKKARRLARAKTLAEMLGVGYSAGVCFSARKWNDASDRTEVKPSPKHANELADSLADGIKDTFGDREVGPWTMTFLLTISIFLSVRMQSRPLTKEELDAREAVRAKSHLRSV